MYLEVYGLASKTIVKEIFLEKEDLNKNLMGFLISKGLPIASSCNGEGVCNKCLVNGDKKSCLHLVKDFLIDNKIKINITYL